MNWKSAGDLTEEIRAGNDIVGVIGGYVRLRKSGRNHKGLCPFHKEKTPSFMVNAERQTFHCFGCGKGGDVFRFIMEMEGVGFLDARRTLAQRSGIRLPDERDPKSREERNRQHDILEFASRFYRALLKSKRGSGAMHYVRNRGITEKTEERFLLGFAPDSWRDLRDGARREGFTDADGIGAGLLIPREGSDPYDRFRNRLLFPIHSVGGRITGFGGRILGDGEPKYLNSPETNLFKKGRALYGLWVTRNDIRGEEEAVLVEGYTDLIALHQAGIENVVAPLGTAFTPEQARLIRNYASRAVLLFDGDEAGLKATIRSLATLAAEGIEARVAILPEGSDPDEQLRKHGVEELKGRIRDASQMVPFLLEKAFPNRREEGIHSLVEVMAAMRDEIKLALLLQETSRYTQIREEVLHREVARIRGAHRDVKPEALHTSPVKRKKETEAERGIAYLCFKHPDLLPEIRRAVDTKRVGDIPARKLFKVLEECSERGEVPNSSHLTLAGLDKDFSRVRLEAEEVDDPIPIIYDYVACVHEGEIHKRIVEIKIELTDAEERKDMDACTRLLEERSRLAEKKRRIVLSLRGGGDAADFTSAERSDPIR